MRLGRVDIDGQARTVRVRPDDTLVDVTPIVGDLNIAQALQNADTLDALRMARAAPPVVEGTYTWLTPIARPSRILCVGFNYRAHAAEAEREEPVHPTFFVRFPSTLAAHGAAIAVPRASKSLDWEGEVAVVIGHGGRAIPREQAASHIAGYTAFADNTVRDFQMHSSQATAGKNFDLTGSYGPWIVSADEAANEQPLAVRTTLNGEVVQGASVADLIFDIPQLIEYVSTWTALEPGDIIATGTPPGIGYRRTPPRYLQAGDELTVELPGLVRLTNRIVREEDAALSASETAQ
jgi:2-keto-4-pentenoate hydratase/2-oxohepta-3-ene-1,7-dioic acid hydratase in catechol pathway